MKRAALAMALAAGFLVGGTIAQSLSDDNDKEPIPPRSIQLTAEQDHVIKEIVLKDMHIEQVPRSTEIRIGEKVPPNIELQTFPPLVAEKVPQVRRYKFFVTENQIVVVSPQNIIAGHNQVAAIRIATLPRGRSRLSLSLCNLDSAEGPSQFEFLNAKSDTEVCMVPPGQKCRHNR